MHLQLNTESPRLETCGHQRFEPVLTGAITRTVGRMRDLELPTTRWGFFSSFCLVPFRAGSPHNVRYRPTPLDAQYSGYFMRSYLLRLALSRAKSHSIILFYTIAARSVVSIFSIFDRPLEQRAASLVFLAPSPSRMRAARVVRMSSDSSAIAVGLKDVSVASLSCCCHCAARPSACAVCAICPSGCLFFQSICAPSTAR